MRRTPLLSFIFVLCGPASCWTSGLPLRRTGALASLTGLRSSSSSSSSSSNNNNGDDRDPLVPENPVGYVAQQLGEDDVSEAGDSSDNNEGAVIGMRGGMGGGPSKKGDLVLDQPSLEGFKAKSVALFSVLLTPATLLSTAGYNSMFSIPLAAADKTAVMLRKRAFILVSGLTLGCALTCVISSAMALFRLRFLPDSEIRTDSFSAKGKVYTLKNFIDDNMKPFFLASFVNFNFALLGFLTVVAIRSQHAIACEHLSLSLVFFFATFAVIMISLVERALYAMQLSMDENSRPIHLHTIIFDYLKFLIGIDKYKHGAKVGPYCVAAAVFFVSGIVTLARAALGALMTGG